MSFASIEEAVDDIREGRMVIVVDDEDRENEGAILCLVSPAFANFDSSF